VKIIPTSREPTQARKQLRQRLLILASLAESADVVVLEDELKRLRHALTSVKFENWVSRDKN
jgi:hypothetical protein